MATYPGATWRGPVPNQGGPMGTVRLGVIHIMSGSLLGTDSWFHDPTAQVSAHFGVGKNGTVYQWVDTGIVAWAEAGYNDVAISIEHEGQTGDLLTQPQIAADRQLVHWLNQTYRLPLQQISDPAGTGWIGHGQLGVVGGNHPNCPGQPILNQWPQVLAGLAPIREEANMITRDSRTGGYWVARANGTVYAYNGAPYLGPAPHFVSQWGIGTSNNPVVGIVTDNQGGFVLAADSGGSQPAIYHIDVSGSFGS